MEKRLFPELRSTQLPVFYATNRIPVSPGEAGHYTARESDRVTLGMAQVTLGEPGWTWEEFVRSERASTIHHPRSARVDDVQEWGTLGNQDQLNEAEQAFVSKINAHLSRTRTQDLVVYVHGYRVTFDEVSVLMGSFAHYLGHAATVSFQWPTDLHFWNYLTDCARARKYIPHIERLISIVSRTKAEHLNLVAYSCGSPLLAEALVRLRAGAPDEDPEALRRRFHIGNVIFAASDIDLRTFTREAFPPIKDMATQVLVYISKNDAALGFSSLMAGGSRLGNPKASELTREDLEALAADPRFEVIDVTDVRGAHEMGGMKGHGYWFANEWISTDITISMRYPIPAGQRCLAPGPGRNMWRLPEDYPDCLVHRLLEMYPEVRRASGP
ncbi:hypothetical protein YTPLAS18_28620 [Nitrospira sp.]|nr:hypothetical protein YTPLAS18_28620 [Nitrospira sp.]